MIEKRPDWYPEIVGIGSILLLIVVAIATTIALSCEQSEPEPAVAVAADDIDDIAGDLCLAWLQRAGDPPAQSAAMDVAVRRAEGIDREPVDIYNSLVVVCPGFAEAAGNLPAEAWQ